MKKEYLIIFSAILAFTASSVVRAADPGKIVFASKLSDLQKMENPGLKSSFNLLDDIQLRVILDEPLAQTYKALNMNYAYDDDALYFNYVLRFYVNHMKEETWFFEMPADDFVNATCIDFTFSTSDEEQKRLYSHTVNHWVDMISALGSGVYKIRVEFIPVNIYKLDRDMPVLARGTITLSSSAQDLETFQNKKSIGLPKPTLINRKIEKMIVMASEHIHPNLVPLDAIITDVKGDWSYGRDDLGNILRRYIIASVFYKNELNGICEVKSGVYYQKHRGLGIFGKLFYLKHANGYYEYPLPCELLGLE